MNKSAHKVFLIFYIFNILCFENCNCDCTEYYVIFKKVGPFFNPMHHTDIATNEVLTASNSSIRKECVLELKSCSSSTICDDVIIPDRHESIDWRIPGRDQPNATIVAEGFNATTESIVGTSVNYSMSTKDDSDTDLLYTSLDHEIHSTTTKDEYATTKDLNTEITKKNMISTSQYEFTATNPIIDFWTAEIHKTTTEYTTTADIDSVALGFGSRFYYTAKDVTSETTEDTLTTIKKGIISTTTANTIEIITTEQELIPINLTSTITVEHSTTAVNREQQYQYPFLETSSSTKGTSDSSTESTSETTEKISTTIVHNQEQQFQYPYPDTKSYTDDTLDYLENQPDKYTTEEFSKPNSTIEEVLPTSNYSISMSPGGRFDRIKNEKQKNNKNLAIIVTAILVASLGTAGVIYFIGRKVEGLVKSRSYRIPDP